jgi:hypothetical protein
MRYYLGSTLPFHQPSLNLFCLQCDLHLGGFDRAQFVIVPKCGKFVVHFLQRSPESANEHHNVIFDHNNNLSHAALYAQFTWAVMKILDESQLCSKRFKFLEAEGNNHKDPKPGASGEVEESGGGRGGDMSGTRKHKFDDGDGEQSDDQGDDDISGTYQPGRSTSDTRTLMLCRWNPTLGSDVLLKMAPGENQSSLEADVHEI